MTDSPGGAAPSRGLRDDPKPGVLFLCVHSAGRSQMALGFFQHLASDGVTAWSGGSEPAAFVNPAAVAAMAECGIDISTEFHELDPRRRCDTRTGCSPTRPVRAWTPSARSATRSSAGCALLHELGVSA